MLDSDKLPPNVQLFRSWKQEDRSDIFIAEIYFFQNVSTAFVKII